MTKHTINQDILKISFQYRIEGGDRQSIGGAYGKLQKTIHFCAPTTHKQTFNFSKCLVIGQLKMIYPLPIACLGSVIPLHC